MLMFILQVFGLVIGVIGAGLGVYSVQGGGHFRFAHAIIGLVLTVIGLQQPINALM